VIVTLTPNPSLDRTLFLDTFTRVRLTGGTLLSRVDDGIPVHVTAADSNVTLSEPASP
jgi:fructose-1-phosphate kinase PfkB-like protein